MEGGLSSAQAERQLKVDGFNEIPEKHQSLASKILKNIISPIALMLFLASGLSFGLGKNFDGYFIIILLAINIAVTIWQENKADHAIEKLNKSLEQEVRVLRDGQWTHLASRLLAKGDYVQLGAGEVIPADGTIAEANRVSANESALTGESLPKDKVLGDKVFSGSFITSGIATIEVTATGARTSFGKTLFSVERITKHGMLEKDIISISKYLTVLSLVAVAALTTVFLLKHANVWEILTLDLSIIVAGIPISLPTVMTLIIELGVLSLAQKKVIVRRLAALEDLANVNFLLTDKTGTLTRNKITVQDIYAYDGFTHDDVLKFASIPAKSESENPIDSAIVEKIQTLNLTSPAFTKNDFIPADSKRKRSTIFITKDGQKVVVSIGAPQIIAGLCVLKKTEQDKFEKEVAVLASSGYRTLAISTCDGTREEKMQLVGLLALSDTLQSDAKSVVNFLEQNGIGVAIVTGDNQAIASQISKELGFESKNIITKSELAKLDQKDINKDFFMRAGAFAEILPEDKLNLVQRAKKFFVVAANGDGINDLPAIKAANVGIAVKNAVAALKATADIVLLSDGISVIKDAIIESRKIFERLYTYSLYRISESLRLIVTIAVLGIAYGVYPMTALQIILIALLNDIPTISLAFDNVTTAKRPAKINIAQRFTLSSLYGLTGVANSLILFVLARNVLHFDWPVIQTMYFLKLTVSGHLLIYVAHTKERWWKFLPSKQVIWATVLTQLFASVLAFTGFMMSGRLALWQIGLVWAWALVWMQISEVVKALHQKSVQLETEPK